MSNIPSTDSNESRAVIYIRVSNRVPSRTALRSIEAQRYACLRRANELGAEIAGRDMSVTAIAKTNS